MKNNTFGSRKDISLTLALSIIAMGINYIIMFILTPYITEHIGTEAYGFVTLAKTISNYGIIITSCLNAFSARFITIAYHEKTIDKANKYFSSVIIANTMLLFFVIIFDVLFVWKIQYFVSIPEEMLHDVRVLFFLDIVNYMLLALGNSFNAYAYIKNKLDRIHIIRIFSYLSEAIVLYFLFSNFTGRIYYVGIALLISTCVLFALSVLFSKRYAPELKVKKKYFSLNAVKDLVLSGIWNSINNIGNLLNSGLDLWVSNLMLSPLAMGELSIVKTVSTIFTTIAQLLCGPFHPQLLHYYSLKDTSAVINVFNKQIRFSGYVVCVITAFFTIFGKSYFHLWTGNQNIDLLYGIGVVTVLGFIFEGIAYPLFYTYTLTLKNRVPCIVTIISGLLNVFGMYVLIKYTSVGLYGVVGTTSVLGFGTYFIFTPLYAAHCLAAKWHSYYPSMIRVLISTGIVCMITYILPFVGLSKNWLELIIRAVCISVIALPIHVLICTNKNEKKHIIKIISSKCKI